MNPTEYLAYMRACTQTLTALITGFSGAGKSWLAATAPKPMLVLDAEGRARYAPSGRKVYWNPATEAPPVYDGTWDTCIVTVVEFSTITQVYTWLRSGQHPFVSVNVDSIMEVQRRCKAAIRPGTSPLERDDWGALLREIEKVICDYRDLVLIPEVGVKVVLFVAGTNSETFELRMDGGIRQNLMYYIDVVGYVFKQLQSDGTFARYMLVDEQPPYKAKDGTNRLKGHFGPTIPLPEGEGPEYQFIEQWFHGLLANGGAHPAPQEGVTA